MVDRDTNSEYLLNLRRKGLFEVLGKAVEIVARIHVISLSGHQLEKRRVRYDIKTVLWDTIARMLSYFFIFILEVGVKKVRSIYDCFISPDVHSMKDKR